MYESVTWSSRERGIIGSKVMGDGLEGHGGRGRTALLKGTANEGGVLLKFWFPWKLVSTSPSCYASGFCRKVPFSASLSLNKHIRHSVNCNEAARQKWDILSENMWKNAPCLPNIEQQHCQHLVLPPLPEEEDLTLDHDFKDFENNPPDIEIPPE